MGGWREGECEGWRGVEEDGKGRMEEWRRAGGKWGKRKKREEKGG